MKRKKLVIIGAGPKALSILAKAEALEKAGWEIPEIIVLEKNEIGANWTGGYGYTDGEVLLASPPLKTFNFPKASIFGTNVAEYGEKYSFINYLSFIGKLERWVDSGMGWVTHREFADYLKWIGGYFSKQIIFGELTKAEAKDSKWVLVYKDNKSTHKIFADGLVFTGPGDISNQFKLKIDEKTIFDAKNWWQNQNQFVNYSGEIALIGGGISASAIFEPLMEIIDKNSVVDWYTRKGLFSRSENFANNQIFSFPEKWQQIPKSVRKSFIASTDRGSIDPTNHRAMSISENFHEVIGEIKKIDTMGKKIRIIFEDGIGEKVRLYDRVILCTGFANDGFKSFLDSGSREKLKRDVFEQIIADISVDCFSPKLYLPMASDINVGIGCARLGSSSAMSDRILSTWATQNPKLEQNDAVFVKIGGPKGDSLFAKKKFTAGEVVVNGYPTKFTSKRTPTSVQISSDMHMEPSFLFVKANHSCNPNCGIQANNLGGYSLIAMQNIAKGEEITWDYAMTEWSSIALSNSTCKCGSLNCRGSVGGYKKLSVDLREKYRNFSALYLKMFT